MNEVQVIASGAEFRRQTHRARMEIVFAEWPKRAVCKGVPLYVMYPDNEADADKDGNRPPFSEARARAVCDPCPVRTECLDWALRANDTWGVHGGLMPDEQREERRRRIRRKALHRNDLAG
ncbi:WhiB family transcriptional regulator [Nonomuraea sp. NPDC005650]|uniref:WhiB family transcriptional regulator n=1 Tax=Nonomuraea sp. NPDC005650 TaxID=3157045 RepID=UPI0033A60034